MWTNGRNATCRRQFLKASAIGTLASQILSASASQFVVESAQQKQATAMTRNRIQKLSLLTASPLPEMAAFYRDVLAMKVELTERLLVINGGETQITFAPVNDDTRPFYHFAFNIPENKILSARKWLGARTKLSVTPIQEREKGLPDDIMPFDHWNAHSIFFWDPAGNILELICRHDLKNGTKGEFRSDEIHYASEIGFATEDVNQLAGDIRSTFQLSQYRGGGDSFKAIGDETGLLIVFQRGGSPVGAKRNQTWQIFPTDVTVRPDIKLESKTDPHSIKAG